MPQDTKLKQGDYCKFKNVNLRELQRYDLQILFGVSTCHLILGVLKDYLTESDVSFSYLGRNYVVPEVLVTKATDEEVKRSSLLAKRKLDIERHPYTEIFK